MGLFIYICGFVLCYGLYFHSIYSDAESATRTEYRKCASMSLFFSLWWPITIPMILIASWENCLKLGLRFK